MSSLPRSRSLCAFIEALPEGYTGEIIGGQLHVQPRPAARHIRLASRLGSKPETPFDEGEGGPGGWWILDEPELPDDHRFGVVPDWLCEIASPSTAALDGGEKMNTCGRFGVAHVWLVDPSARMAEAFVNADGEGRWRDAGTVRGDEAVSFRLPWP